MTISKANADAAAKLPTSRPVSNGVNTLLRSLELDSAGKARAEVASALAKRMDQPGTGATTLALLAVNCARSWPTSSTRIDRTPPRSSSAGSSRTMSVGHRLRDPRDPEPQNMLGPATKIAGLLGLELMPHQSDAIALVTESDHRGILVFSDVTSSFPANTANRPYSYRAPRPVPRHARQSVRLRRPSLKGGPQDAARRWVPILDASPLKGTYSVRAANGSEAIRFTNGAVIELLVSTTTKAGHGQVWDLCVLDEAFTQVDSRVETTILPAFATRTERVRACSGSSSPPPAQAGRAPTCSTACRVAASSPRPASHPGRPTSNTQQRKMPTTPTPRSGRMQPGPRHHDHPGRRQGRTHQPRRGRFPAQPPVPLDHPAP